MSIERMKAEIDNANSIVILTHRNPDGDAIGSSLAMFEYLKGLNKNVDVIITEVPKEFDFLSNFECIRKESTKKYDLAIVVDTSCIELLEDKYMYFETAKIKIVIDHHKTNQMYGDINLVDPNSPACAQVLVNLFEMMGVKLTKVMMLCLITGIITDTGGFKFSNVNSDTFLIAAKALDFEINISKICVKVLEIKTKSKFDLSKIAYDNMEFLMNGKVAFTFVTLDDQKRVKCQLGDYIGIVNIGRNVENVEISLFAREIKHNVYYVSIRSNSDISAINICTAFNGGGHSKAAGCNISGKIEDVKIQLLDQIKLQLR